MISLALSEIAEKAAASSGALGWGPSEHAVLVRALSGLRWSRARVATALGVPGPHPWRQLVVHRAGSCQSSVFVLPEGATIPLHDHPAMTALCKVLHGRMRIHTYRWLDGARLLATDHGTTDLDPESPVSALLPHPGELHEVTALTDCAFFDVCTPYYDDDAGRPCRYYGVAGPVGPGVVQLMHVKRRIAKQAILLVEARGAAVNFQEDANLSLVQAGVVARRFLDDGYRVAVRMVLDPGQSIEEYSVLCHASRGELDRIGGSIATASDMSAARHAVVARVREACLPIVFSADQLAGVPVEDRLFHGALLSRVVGMNDEVVRHIRACRHPLVDPSALDGYEDLLQQFVGQLYLDLEAAVARRSIERCVGDRAADALEVSTVSRPEGPPAGWLTDPICAEVVRSDLAAKSDRQGGESFESRLVGLFTTVQVAGEERPYFNSPTTCRYEHGRARVIARDRFGILSLQGSERLSFDRLRSLVREQGRGAPDRPLALKYPYTARYLAASIATEALATAEHADVTVVFIEGVAGTVNPGTGGLLDRELSALLARTPVTYRRLSAPAGSRSLLPRGPGGLPLIHDRLAAHITATLPDDPYVPERASQSTGQRPGPCVA